MKIYRFYVEKIKLILPPCLKCVIFYYFKFKFFFSIEDISFFWTIQKKVVLSTCKKNLNVNSNIKQKFWNCPVFLKTLSLYNFFL